MDGCGCLYVRLVFISGSGFGKKTPTLSIENIGKIRQEGIISAHLASKNLSHTCASEDETAVFEMSRAIKRRGAPSKDD